MLGSRISGRAPAGHGRERQRSITPMALETLDRREFVVGSVAAGATLLLPGGLSAAEDGKKTFTILHTNDLHSNLIGMGPASDYTPFALNNDTTQGGYARLATLIAKRKAARQDQGPVLVLDAGDYSMTGKLEVDNVKVHKVPVQEDGIWTQVPRYTFEGMDFDVTN
jgi:hypothetical protein